MVKKYLAFGLGMICIFGLISCGHSDPGEPTQQPIGSIKVDGYVPTNMRNQMAHAVGYLTNLNLKSSPDLDALIEEPKVDSPFLLGWLNDRVGYLLPEEYSFKDLVHVTQNYYPYENPDELPQSKSDSVGLMSTGHAEVMMANSGAGIYIQAKQMKVLAAVHVRGVGDVPITSPRVGVLQIGDGLSSVAQYSFSHALDIYILSILFHEARHSDGHGKTTGFIHAICPKGHKYEGLYACDRNANGPYSVEREVLNSLIASCVTCSASQLEYLNYNLKDIQSRVLVTDKSGRWDPSPEGHR